MINFFRAAISKETGAASGSNRVKRGGSWNNNANNASVSNRNNNNPSNRNNNLGFRLVRSAQHNLTLYGRSRFLLRVYRNRRGNIVIIACDVCIKFFEPESFF